MNFKSCIIAAMIFLSKVKILKNLKNSSRTQYISIHLKKQYLAYKQQLPESQAVLVVGCDSMLEIDGQMLGKPHLKVLLKQTL